jgi:hypothetical protein
MPIHPFLPLLAQVFQPNRPYVCHIRHNDSGFLSTLALTITVLPIPPVCPLFRVEGAGDEEAGGSIWLRTIMRSVIMARGKCGKPGGG